MSEIRILDQIPMILTKDTLFKSRARVRPGAMIVLPDDAVLVVLPVTEEQSNVQA